MAKRSTRKKIRFQVDKAANNIDRAIEHLHSLDVIADKRSPDLNENIPKFVFMLDEFRKMLLKWRESL